MRAAFLIPPRYGDGDRPQDGEGAGMNLGAAPPPRVCVAWSPFPCRGGVVNRILVLFLVLLVAPACGARAQAPAWQAHSLVHGGSTRTWHEIVPPACAARTARCPLLVALHGGGGMMNGAQFATGTGLAETGAARNYVVLAPDALGDNWNDGRPEMAAGIDDVGFIRAMLADVQQRAGVDPARVFAAGASNGGLMSYRLACETGSTFRAVAPIIANLGTALIDHCRPTGNVSVLMMPGNSDPLMPYGGGPVAPGMRDRGTVVSSDRTLLFWRDAMECRGAPHVERFDPVRDDTAVAITRYASCRGGAVVQRWTVEGGGHTWPRRGGARGGFRARLTGATASEFSATDIIFDFFDSVGRAQ
jgi:polyhydroxybutyrate depolymerase